MPSEPQPGTRPHVTPEQHQGAIYRPLHVERQVKIYPIQEHELTTLSTLSTHVTLWCSIGSMAVALLLGCLWDMMNLAEKSSPSRQAIVFMLACFAIAAASFITAYMYKASGKSALEKILAETQR